ncbi:MAG: hypothetical protein ACKVWV_04635 [Planctomycetota bacterium]
MFVPLAISLSAALAPPLLASSHDGDSLALRLEGGRVHCEAAGHASLAIELSAWGRASDLVPAEDPAVRVTARGVELERGNLVEWYVEGARGIEHGFTIAVRPLPSRADESLLLRLAFGESYVPRETGTGDTVALDSVDGNGTLLYTGLYALDARGTRLPSRLQVDGDHALIDVDDCGAAYPILIDPWILVQDAILSVPNELFGRSVDLDGDTLVVGAQGYNPAPQPGGIGAAYVYRRVGSAWTLEARLLASDGVPGDAFGRSVAIDGDTVAVGAGLEDHDGFNAAGAVYVFVRSGGVWTEQAKLVASDPVNLAGLGGTVSLHGDTVVSGASSAPAPIGSGAVYVFARAASVWTQQAKLVAPTPRLGESVAIDGDTVVAGSPTDSWVIFGEGSAHVFVRSGASWSPPARLVASDPQFNVAFASSVDVAGDTIAVGTPGWNGADGAVYVFQWTGSAWREVQRVSMSIDAGQNPTRLGECVALYGNMLLAGGPLWGPPGVGLQFAGRAYLFERTRGRYRERAAVQASDATGAQQFGTAVAISGDRLVVGNDDTSTPNDKVYVFHWEPESTFCFGDGSLPTPCPCAPPDFVPNPSGAAGFGCANSFDFRGANLGVGGVIHPDTLIFRADIGSGYSGFAMIVKGDATAAQGIASHDGVRCVDGAMIRFGGHMAGTQGDSTGSWTYPNSVQTIAVSVSTGQGPAQTANYQLFYRNAMAGFCSPATANWSNAVEIIWP